VKLRIGHRWVSVEPITAASHDEINGDWSADLNRIRIRSDIAPEEQAETLLHEVIHAFYSVYDLERTGPKKRDQEEVCEALDGPLAAVFQANPELLAMLHLALEGRCGLFSPSKAPPAARRGRPVGQARRAA